jgi:hypothetical protein
MQERVWPVGTMVVLLEGVTPGDGGHPRPKGACGVVIKSPDEATGSYRVRFPDGGEFGVEAGQLEVLKKYQRGELGDTELVASRHDLYAHVHYRCVVGSRAYGLEHAGSDTDLRGFYVAPADLQWSIYGVPEQLERPGADEVYWEIGKFIKLALKANPNVLECLYTPLVEHTSELGERVLAAREVFLSKMIYQTYSRYVMSQFKAMNRKLRAGEAPNPKHSMHLIRLMLSGLTILREGFVPVRADAHAERLLAIKSGEIPWEEVDAWRLELHAEFDEVFEASSLPERPDYAQANAILVRARYDAAGLRWV